MATRITSRSRAWFFPTSPRSPYKLQGELALLKQLEGRPWDTDTQIAFAHLLQRYPDFDGNISDDDPAFSARDRATRAPRLLGFVHLPKRGTRGPLRFTEVGNAFIEASEVEQVLIFQRQLAKVQFRSPLHDSGGFEQMHVKPLTAMIRLLLELEHMSKEEVALFGVTLTDARRIGDTLRAVRDYRDQLAARNAAARKIYRRQYADERIRTIYAEDIDAGHTRLREGGHDFVRIKWQTLVDYADATIRYLRASGLFTVSPHGQRLVLLDASANDARFLLERYGTGLSPDLTGLTYDDYVSTYLGNASAPEIRRDDLAAQGADVRRLVASLEERDPAVAQALSTAYRGATSSLQRLQILARLEKAQAEWQVRDEARSIRQDQAASLAEIKAFYEEISSRQAQVVDRPLMYEWNTWRAMVLMNDARSVQGNYTTDAAGNPLSTAGGNQPDIRIEYETFHLIVEVTLSAGRRQYETEGEPVSRHLGTLQRELLEAGDERPVFGIFVAETLNETVVQHLLTQARFRSQVYRGSIRIVPLPRNQFEDLVSRATSLAEFSHVILFRFFEAIFAQDAIQLGEYDWQDLVGNKIRNLHILAEAP